MNTQHTKGQWRVSVWDYPQATPPRKELNIETSEILLATVQCDHEGDNPYVVPKAEAEANARLMVKAPALLDLLIEALPYVEEGEQFNKPKYRALSLQIRDMLKKIETEEITP